MSYRLMYRKAVFTAVSILFIVMCLGGAAAAQDSIEVLLPKIDFSDAEEIEIPNGRPIYAILVSGYHQNERFDTFHFYRFARCVLERGGYVHYAWWNNLLAPYMERPLHDPSSEPGNFPSGDWLGFVPILDLTEDKATPSEDYQFQFDLENLLSYIRANNPDAVVVLVGHSMGGDAVARFGASTDYVIDLLAPIDPVGNRTCTQWSPGSAYEECATFLVQNTRFRATHEDYFWFPNRRIFGSNIQYLYHRWQQEFVPPFDYGCPPGGPHAVLCSPNPFVPEEEYTFDFNPPRTRAFGIGQGSTNVQSILLTSLFSGCDLDPRWWVCPNWLGGFDGHGEIVGFRGVDLAELESVPIALEARGDWPHRYSDPDATDSRVQIMKEWDADPYYLDTHSLPAGSGVPFAPQYPNLCKVSGDLCTILATIMGEVPPVNQLPIADANGPYESECEGATTMVSLDGTGSSDPEGGNLSYLWRTDCPGVDPEDPTSSFNDPTSATPLLAVDTSNGCAVECVVELTVTDDSDNTDTAPASVSLTDTVSPELSVPADITVECNESSDPSHTGWATAIDDCDPSPTISYEDVETPSSCPQETTITRTWTAADYCGNSRGHVQTIEIVDTTPPVITSLTVSPNTLWPPNGKMRPVEVSVTAVDACDTEPVCSISSIISNEPEKRGAAIEITGDLTANLKSKRHGKGSGRIYSISVECRDACGNSTSETTSVTVPHDQRKLGQNP